MLIIIIIIIIISLSNPWSDESEGDQGGANHNCHCLWPLFWPCCSAQPHSCCPTKGASWGTSHCLAVTGRLADHGDESWLWKLNDINVGGMEWGWPGPLGSMCPLVMAWAVNHLPSPRLTGLALSCVCLPTQAMTPDNVNVVSLTSPMLSPSPNDCCP